MSYSSQLAVYPGVAGACVVVWEGGVSFTACTACERLWRWGGAAAQSETGQMGVPFVFLQTSFCSLGSSDVSPQLFCVQTDVFAVSTTLAIKALMKLFKGWQRAKKRKEGKKKNEEWARLVPHLHCKWSKTISKMLLMTILSHIQSLLDNYHVSPTFQEQWNPFTFLRKTKWHLIRAWLC